MYQPVVIIGAARSGTNMLRDVLVKLPGVGTWPCDEINYIWRYGNALHPTDELEPALATPRVQNYIQRAFSRLSREKRLGWVVEKTCANSLRVAFVDRVLPDAKYIFLVRDGRDVTVSAMRHWRAALDIPYLAKKARYVPPADLPYYALRYLSNRLHRLIAHDNRLASWGPRFDSMEKMLKARTLAEVCAVQWARSVGIARYDFSRIDADRVCTVKYEQFVTHPESELGRLLQFLEIDGGTTDMSELVAHVSPKSAGNWRRRLTRQTVQQIEPLMHRELEHFGYEPAAAMEATSSSLQKTPANQIRQKAA
jgi:hypothetical protein